jgi:hypothetical protein
MRRALARLSGRLADEPGNGILWTFCRIAELLRMRSASELGPGWHAWNHRAASKQDRQSAVVGDSHLAAWSCLALRGLTGVG